MSEAWQIYEGWTQKDGTISVRAATNDDRDLGYPNDHAEWTMTCKDVADFNKRCGTSRKGISGVDVVVRLDGEIV